MTDKVVKTIRLITKDGAIELQGTPEELADLISKRNYDNVIQFPLRGIYAHPSNPSWGSE